MMTAVRTIHRTIQARIRGMPEDQRLDPVEQGDADQDAQEGQYGQPLDERHRPLCLQIAHNRAGACAGCRERNRVVRQMLRPNNPRDAG